MDINYKVQRVNYAPEILMMVDGKAEDIVCECDDEYIEVIVAYLNAVISKYDKINLKFLINYHKTQDFYDELTFGGKSIFLAAKKQYRQIYGEYYHGDIQYKQTF